MLDWRAYQVISWTVLAVSVTVYALAGFPWPRPAIVFFGTGLSIGILYLQVRAWGDRMGAIGYGFVYFTGLMNAFFLRYTEWVRVVAAGSDMISHYVIRAGYIVSHGHVNSELGMYSQAPLIHVFITINKLVSGLWILDVRFAAVVLSTTVPLLIATFAKRVDGHKTAGYALLLSVPFPLFLRTGAMFDSESLAIPWFVLLLYFLYRSIFAQDQRYRLLVVFLALGAAWIHFLYPVVIVGTIFGTVVLAEIMAGERIPKVSLGQFLSAPVLGLLAGFSFIFFRLLWTDDGARMFVGLGITGSTFELASLGGSLFPQSGAVGDATTAATGLQKLMNLTPVVIFVVLGATGGGYMLYKRSPRYLVLAVVSGIITFGTMLAIVGYTSSSSFRLGYRLYYYISLVGLVPAAIGLHRICEPLIVQLRAWQSGLSLGVGVLLFVAVVSFGMLGPMSTYGNNVDPHFGGQSSAVTETEYNQLFELNNVMDRPIAESKVEEYKPPDQPSSLFPHRDTDSKTKFPYLTYEKDNCSQANSPWTTNEFRICANSEIN